MAIYLTESDVAGLVGMPVALQALELAHVALANGEATDIPRQRVRTFGVTQHVLQAAWPARGGMGYKAYTSSAHGNRFWFHLFDSASGEPLAVIEADRLGMLRTGAAGGLAVRCLARPGASLVGVIGAGWQARGQILALTEEMELDSVKVYSRRADKLDSFCKELSEFCGVLIVPVANARVAIDGSDVIVTATTASRPVLEGAWLVEGTHVNAVGSNALWRQELDEKAITQADVICVDAVATALCEAGDLLAPLEKGRLQERQLVELGEVLSGARPGRENDRQRTVFESQGLAIQDLSLAIEVFERAKTAGIGVAMPY